MSARRVKSVVISFYKRTYGCGLPYSAGLTFYLVNQLTRLKSPRFVSTRIIFYFDGSLAPRTFGVNALGVESHEYREDNPEAWEYLELRKPGTLRSGLWEERKRRLLRYVNGLEEADTSLNMGGMIFNNTCLGACVDWSSPNSYFCSQLAANAVLRLYPGYEGELQPHRMSPDELHAFIVEEELAAKLSTRLAIDHLRPVARDRSQSRGSARS